MNSAKSHAHYVRHERFPREQLHLKTLRWDTGGQSPRYWLEAGEPRSEDQFYVLMAVQESAVVRPIDPGRREGRIQGHRHGLSLNQAMVQKIVKRPSGSAFDGFDFVLFDGVAPFDWNISGQELRRQIEKFRSLYGPEIENSPAGGLPASPETILSFADNLMVCATEQSAASRIESDRKAAMASYILTTDFESADNRENILLLIPEPVTETPFSLIASIARARAQLAIEKHGGRWGTR